MGVIGIEKAEIAKDETGTVEGRGAIQGAEVEAEIARIVMVTTAAEGTAPVLVLKGVGKQARTSRRRRKRRRRRKKTEQIIRILRLRKQTGFGRRWD